VRDQLAAAKEARRKRTEEVNAQKTGAKVKREDMIIGAIYGGDLTVRELTSDYIAHQDRLQNRQRISAPLPMVAVHVGGSRHESRALIDTGACTNCLSEEFAKEQGLVLNQIHGGMTVLKNMRAANKGAMHCIGWVSARVNIAGSDITYNPVIFAVFRNLSLEVILGTDWISLAQLETHHMGDGSCICRAHAPDGSRSVRWQAAAAISEYPPMDNKPQIEVDIEELSGND
jgi:hypothetical protein